MSRPLTQDEAEVVGVDGRDGTGVYRLSDLTEEQLALLPEMCPDCEHPVDDHDRRAEDGTCSVCAADEPCSPYPLR